MSLFSSSFVFHWNEFFGDTKLIYPPMFDARVVIYPAIENIRDYMNWRQADCHINNLYNTCFWTLVNKGGLSTTEAESKLKGTLSGDKNEILFTEYDINYNNEPDMFKKGSVLIRESYEEEVSKKDRQGNDTGKMVKRARSKVIVLHEDIIGDSFWLKYSNIL